ncbi:MAG TPA: BrnT family toxin [Burkholderiaceae bacterium]|nr:BrnT family toxin [Burkholderiaceae bacterium]
MAIEFDPKKDAANRRKHGISLSEGDGVTDDPFVLTLEDESSREEQRFIALGRNIFGQLRLVVYTYRGEVVRLISVRRPDAKQAKAYEQGT